MSPENRGRWKGDFARAAAILAVSSLLALSTNALFARPVPLFSLDGPGAWPERAPRLSVAALESAVRERRAILVLDVRREEAFLAAHPAMALNAPYERFMERYGSLGLGPLVKAAETVVLLCESSECPTADRAALLLKHSGHSNIHVLEGGWAAYRMSGMETKP